MTPDALDDPAIISEREVRGPAGSMVTAGHATADSVSRREIAGVLAVLAVAAALFLAPAMLGGRIESPADLLFGGYPWRAHVPPGWAGPSNGLLVDSVQQFEPWLTAAARRLHAGGLPLWNPDNMLGAPLFGNPQTALLDPLNWPFLLTADPRLLTLRAWLRLVIAGLGLYLLARQACRVGRVAAMVGALTFTFCAYLVVWLLYPLAGTAIWLPWLWWATARLAARPGPRGVAVLAVCVALSLLAGHPETAAHMALATGAFAIFATWQAGPVGARRIVGGLLAWGAAYALGTVLAAVQLLPFLDYLGQSWVLASRAGGSGFSLPFYFAWTLVSPDLFGNPAHSTWWAPGVIFNYNEVTGYSGILPLLLAPVALLARGPGQRRLALFLAGLALLAAGVVYRAPVVYEVVTALPLLHNAANHRFLLVVEFALALLAALGVNAIQQRPAGERWRLALVLAGATGVLAVGALGVPWVLGQSYFLLPAGSAAAVATWSAGLLRVAAVLLTAAGLLAAIVGLRRARPRLAAGLVGLLPLLVYADLGQAYGDYNPSVAPAAYFPPSQVTDYLQAQPGPARYTGLIPPNVNLMYGLAAVTGYDAIEAQTYHELVSYIDPQIPRNVRRHFNPFDMLQSRIWNLLGVRYVLATPGANPNDLPDVRQEASDGHSVGEIWGAQAPGQSFIAGHTNLAGIQVLAANYEHPLQSPLLFHIRTDPTGPDLVTAALDPTGLPDNSWWTVRFSPVATTPGRRYVFVVTAPGATSGAAATLWYSAADVYPDGTRLDAGHPVAGDLAFRTFSAFDGSTPWLVPLAGPAVRDAAVYVNQQALPRAWLVHQVTVERDPALQVPALYAPGFDWRTTALLGDPLPGVPLLPPAPPSAAADTVTITRYLPESVDIDTASTAAAVLVLADQAFSGWQAAVDGAPVPVLTVDHALRGVRLPAGTHRVSFRYVPVALTAGAVGSALGLLGLVLLWIIPGAVRRPGGAASDRGPLGLARPRRPDRATPPISDF